MGSGMHKGCNVVSSLKSLVLSVCLLAMLVGVGCSGGSSTSETATPADTSSPADKVAAAKKESLPNPSSLSESEDPPMVITAKDLVKGISSNKPKQNIKEYFGKFADITGVVRSKDEVRGTLEIVLDGETEGALGFLSCKASEYDQATADAISPGDTITISGQIKALTEAPGQGGQDMNLLKAKAQIIKPCEIK